WPQARAVHWKTLLTARAIENQSFVIGVNRVGTDGNGLEYSGDSCVIDPTGRALFQAAYQETIHTSRLSYNDLDAYRRSFPALKDADRFQIEI
ncbi:MAG: nitrilase-related carbon-nitrogen hydrolase, partial [Thermodesulfobacteriota bacterium]|nr:nitrilase-related carbon-nitrogen hydrolase [Thermodesulfobacteriota bacterium]